MGDISAHFNRSEFACRCNCGFDTVDTELIAVLEDVRQHFMKPITITSGCRCSDHNLNVGGSYDSQHVKARAADFHVEGVEPEKVYAYIDQLHNSRYGLGLYSSWVHFDSRQGRARWKG